MISSNLPERQHIRSGEGEFHMGVAFSFPLPEAALLEGLPFMGSEIDPTVPNAPQDGISGWYTSQRLVCWWSGVASQRKRSVLFPLFYYFSMMHCTGFARGLWGVGATRACAGLNDLSLFSRLTAVQSSACLVVVGRRFARVRVHASSYPHISNVEFAPDSPNKPRCPEPTPKQTSKIEKADMQVEQCSVRVSADSQTSSVYITRKQPSSVMLPSVTLPYAWVFDHDRSKPKVQSTLPEKAVDAAKVVGVSLTGKSPHTKGRNKAASNTIAENVRFVWEVKQDGAITQLSTDVPFAEVLSEMSTKSTSDLPVFPQPQPWPVSRVARHADASTNTGVTIKDFLEDTPMKAAQAIASIRKVGVLCAA